MELSAVSSALQTIGGLLTEEVTSLLGVEEQVGGLERELKMMRGFLKEADARKADNEVVRACVAEIRELAYDAEDVIETFALKVAAKRNGGFLKALERSACFLREGWLLHETKSEIEKITARIQELVRQLQMYDVTKLGEGEGSSSSSERRESRRPYPHIIEDNVVGMKDDIKKLVSVLVDEESDCRVVSICGIGGLGKTTLAKRVYHHSQVRGHFNHLAWVYVSQQCQRRNVWEGILSSFNMMPMGDKKMRDEELAEKLFNFLKDEKCLVILDDIWSIQAWESLKAAFPMRETSKILLTSRNKELVSHADRRGYLHELQCLKEEESWELFRKIAFPNIDSPDYRVCKRMEYLGETMSKHCAGLPLAIILLGGILASKSSLNEWQKVFENVKANLRKGKGQGGIEDVLALSYDDLPPYLRPCFLYLSVFPEDYEIHAQRLIQLWVAEGIVSSTDEEGNGREVIEDVAEYYLIELVERCMIQVRERDVATLKIKTFDVHDLMKDLCLSKAKQENFLSIIDESITYLHGNNVLSLSTTSKVRRAAAHHCFQIQHIKSPHLRSLLVFENSFLQKITEMSMPLILPNFFNDHEDGEGCNPHFCIVGPLVSCTKLLKYRGILTYMFKNLKLLRVLDFEAGGDDAGCKLSSDIGDLVHLRFLSLRYLEFGSSKLPSSLGKLRCLQTLDLRVIGRVHVPNVIWRMEQLRHLYLPRFCDRKTKLKLGALRNLQTLVNFNTKSCYVEDLQNMTNLRELEIRGPFNIEVLEDLGKNTPIIGSKYLQSLSIYSIGERIDPRLFTHLLSNCVSICKLSLAAGIGKLPEDHHFSQDITYIYLSLSELDEDPMPILEKLHNLRILKFDTRAFVGKEMICSTQGFPRLDSLSLRWLPYLEEWKVEEGAMPALRRLEIDICKRMKKLPDGLSFITTLQELTIRQMPKEFQDKLVEGGEDFHKVLHVSSIKFENCDRPLSEGS